MVRPLSLALLAIALGSAACSDDFQSASGEHGGSAGAGAQNTGGSGGSQAGASGSGGSSGSAGVGGAAGSAGTEPQCPTDLEGPELVDARTVQEGRYCIDSTEVTQQQYAKFLAAVDAASSQKPPGCEGKLGHVPQLDDNVGCSSSAYNPSAAPNHPVVCVDWCDAWAYCAWAGKRLCGRVGAGAASYTAPADPAESQWFNACSRNGELGYPYGSSYEPTRCNGLDSGKGMTVASGSLPECQGGFEGIFDMSGNVSEWEDACDGAAANSNCRRRGGGFKGAEGELACGYQKGNVRTTAWGDTGFRCCLN